MRWGSASRLTETGWIVLLKSWLQSLGSPHTQRNFEVTARRFLAGLPDGAPRRHRRGRARCRDSMSSGLSEASARQ
jgi:hypothetical protein